jgi:hypothetical protein
MFVPRGRAAASNCPHEVNFVTFAGHRLDGLFQSVQCEVARMGEMMPPCGVPASVGNSCPFSM